MDLKAGSNLFFTSDLHFFHKSMAERRGFANVEEMNQALIEAWNSRVRMTDVVWVLGDISFGGSEATIEVFKQLNGKKHLVLGNHDEKFSNSRLLEIFESVQHYKKLKVSIPQADGSTRVERIVLCHFPILVWDQAHYGSWHLHGHSHGMCNYPHPEMRIADVGVDNSHTFAPIAFEDIANYMGERRFVSFDGHAEKTL